MADVEGRRRVVMADIEGRRRAVMANVERRRRSRAVMANVVYSNYRITDTCMLIK